MADSLSEKIWTHVSELASKFINWLRKSSFSLFQNCTKMKSCLLPLVCLLFAFTPVDVEWKSVTLAEKVSIELPGSPTENSDMGFPMQKVTLGDGAEFNAFAIDYSKFGVSEEMLKSMAESGQIKEQIESMTSAQPGVKLIKNEEGKYQDKYPCYNLVLEMEKDGVKATVNQRTVIFKQYIINTVYQPGKSGSNEDMKNKFFNSLKLAE